MRLIDGDAMEEQIRKRYCEDCKVNKRDYDGVRCRACAAGDMLDDIEDMRTVDAVPVVRCKDCTYYHDVDGVMKCHIWEVFREMASPPENGYCHCGKRKWVGSSEGQMAGGGDKG